jgi:hypothetical protein
LSSNFNFYFVKFKIFIHILVKKFIKFWVKTLGLANLTFFIDACIFSNLLKSGHTILICRLFETSVNPVNKILVSVFLYERQRNAYFKFNTSSWLIEPPCFQSSLSICYFQNIKLDVTAILIERNYFCHFAKIIGYDCREESSQRITTSV